MLDMEIWSLEMLAHFMLTIKRPFALEHLKIHTRWIFSLVGLNIQRASDDGQDFILNGLIAPVAVIDSVQLMSPSING